MVVGKNEPATNNEQLSTNNHGTDPSQSDRHQQSSRCFKKRTFPMPRLLISELTRLHWQPTPVGMGCFKWRHIEYTL